MERVDDQLYWYRLVARAWARRLALGRPVGDWSLGTRGDVDFALEAARLGPGSRVLDLGCGWGRHALLLAQQGCHVTGVDGSEELLALAEASAQRHGVDLNLRRGDMRTLPAFRQPFDAVLELYDFTTVARPTREDALDSLRAVRSALRPGGVLILGETDYPLQAPVDMERRLRVAVDGLALHVREYYQDSPSRLVYAYHLREGTRTLTYGEVQGLFWSPPDLAALLAEAGLQVRSWHHEFAMSPPWGSRDEGLVLVAEAV